MCDGRTDLDVQVADMLISLGYWSRNPLFVIDGRDGPVVELDPHDWQGGWFYTCRHFVPGSGDCGVYERRPRMCRQYPSNGKGGPCTYLDCTAEPDRSMEVQAAHAS